MPELSVRGSRSRKPIMVLFDLLGRRWAMGVLWTLCTSGPCTFRDLQDQCGSVSPSVLNARLKELRNAKLIGHSGQGYHAEPLGFELHERLVPLGAWSRSWAALLASDAPEARHETAFTQPDRSSGS
ncbi:winged helix-turn-helix transcriptional regulator [Microvirga pudoricolor]|uniref:winged helix-turn-helix transcriptional regulator n=1 Tax=Microvirga pudoricolor TaxID=2778729 RepID=UPI00194F66B6|nr:winged helix-turn-helix transcriptional regulator [Microvirga pudoricolor]MBM6594616.1 helix-turn-helix transcriptional regulator [Microvirga pudoricolor]